MSRRITWGESWSTGDTYNAVIGQGYVHVTPLQMLNAYNAVIIESVRRARGDGR